jgi:esterase/lipase superfamily enzyme
MKKWYFKKWLFPGFILFGIFVLYVYNKPVKKNTVLMSTPLTYRDSRFETFLTLPDDVSPPVFDVYFATDREPAEKGPFQPEFYGNERSSSLSLGIVKVRLGAEEMNWPEIRATSLMEKRTKAIPLSIERIESLHKIGTAVETLEASLHKETLSVDPFISRINHRLANSDTKSIFIFVPGFRVDFTYPVLVATELWYYMGCSGAFIAYSWPSKQRLRDYFSDIETAAFTAQHFRMLLLYLADRTEAEYIHILSYSAGARIVSQALHELRLMTYGIEVSQFKKTLKIGQVIFTAPDIDLMLFAARYRDGFADIADKITIYTNANDNALNWALRFFGWPRLGAPGELGLTPEEIRSLEDFGKTVIIDVAEAENSASGNGHGYFIKSPWVSSDILLTLRCGLVVSERGLLKPKGLTVWSFHSKYPSTIRRLIKKIIKTTTY